MPYAPTNWNNNQAPAINAANLNKIESGISQLYANLDTFTTGTLVVDNWEEAVGSYTYDLTETYDNTYNLTISVAPTANADQYNAFAAAKICGSATDNIITALGVKPTVDIPIIIKVVKK